LEERDAEKARLVELHFYMGLTRGCASAGAAAERAAAPYIGLPKSTVPPSLIQPR